MKDQTDYACAAITGPEDRGTGVYLRLESDGSTRKVLIRVRSYVEFVDHAEDPAVIACRWVPEQIMSYLDLQNTSCIPDACVDRCIRLGCLCHPNTKMCG
jgi:hypothetical protein